VGTPEHIATIAESHTGFYLAPLLGMPSPISNGVKKKAPTKVSAKKAPAKKAPAKKAAVKSLATGKN
jgi:excinuclease ABC subunit A